MNEFKPLLRLLVLTQTFLLFAILFLPTLIHYLPQTLGRFVYGLLAVICILLALRLRRFLSDLEA